MIAIAEFFETGIRRSAAATARADVFDEDELLGLLDRQHAQQNGIDEAEDGCVRADAQRERQDRDGGESRRGAQRAHGVAQILHQTFDGGPSLEASRQSSRQSVELPNATLAWRRTSVCADAGREAAFSSTCKRISSARSRSSCLRLHRYTNLRPSSSNKAIIRTLP